MTDEETASYEASIKITDAEKISSLKEKLATYDYIGVKIAMGVATREEYAEQIAYTESLRQQIRELEE